MKKLFLPLLFIIIFMLGKISFATWGDDGVGCLQMLSAGLSPLTSSVALSQGREQTRIEKCSSCLECLGYFGLYRTVMYGLRSPEFEKSWQSSEELFTPKDLINSCDTAVMLGYAAAMGCSYAIAKFSPPHKKHAFQQTEPIPQHMGPVSQHATLASTEMWNPIPPHMYPFFPHMMYPYPAHSNMPVPQHATPASLEMGQTPQHPNSDLRYRAPHAE